LQGPACPHDLLAVPAAGTAIDCSSRALPGDEC
jgi:hypothetical protein